MVLMVVIMGLGPLFYKFLGFRYTLKHTKTRNEDVLFAPQSRGLQSLGHLMRRPLEGSRD